MSNLEKIKQNETAIAVIAEVLNDKPLNLNSKKDNLIEITKYFIKAIELTGSKVGEDLNATKFIIENFYEQIYLKNPHARLREIEYCFKKGALKDYGDYFGWNVQTLWGFWKAYISSEERSLAIIAKNKKETEALKLTDKPLYQASIEDVRKFFEEYKTTGNLPAYARVYYSILLKHFNKKTLIEDDEVRIKIKEDALKEYELSLRAKRLHISDPKTFSMLMYTVLDKIAPNRSYESIAIKLALKHYFDELIKNGGKI